MARVFPSNQDYGWLAFDAAGAAPTAMYWYPLRFGVDAGKEHLWCFKQHADGAYNEGPKLDYVQALTNNPDMSSASVSTEDEGPYAGDPVITFTMAP